MHVTRRVALILPLLLAACGGAEPPAQDFPAPHYDYLPQIRLSVADIDIDDSWAPRGEARHVENLAPVPPRDALRQMAQDRLFASGGAGRASYVIEDASIVRDPRQYIGSFAVRIDIADATGAKIASATARATRTRLISGESRNGVRSDLYGLVTDMMADMNVELEYQLRRALREAPMATRPISPEPEPVLQQDLNPAPGDPAPTQIAPAPVVPSPILPSPALPGPMAPDGMVPSPIVPGQTLPANPQP